MTESTAHLASDRLLDLVQGYGSEEEARVALDHLSACARCEREFAGIAGRMERVRARGELRQVDGRWELRPYPRSEGFSHRRRRLASPLGGVGMIATAVAVLLLFFGPKPTPTPEGPIPPMPELGKEIRLRATPGTEGADPLQPGLAAYHDGDLRRCIDLLSNASASGSREHLRRIFLGSALARSGDPAAAIEVLQGLPFHAIPDPWGSEARWVLYVALDETGRAAEAEAVLEELLQEPGPVGDRARKLVPEN